MAFNEQQLWRDAWHIAWVGASNAKAVARTVADWLVEGVPVDHTALRAMIAHLSFLSGQSIGPNDEDLIAVRHRYIGVRADELAAERKDQQ